MNPCGLGIAVLTGCLVTGCLGSTDRDRVGALALRVDSLAIVVTQLASDRGRLAQPEFASFSLVQPAVPFLEYGRPDAPVVMVEFTDYQCPFCRQFAETAWPLLLAGPIARGELRHLVVDLPLDAIHPFAGLAARAVWCAHRTGPIVRTDLRSALYRRQVDLRPEVIDSLVSQSGFPGEEVLACADAEPAHTAISKSLALAAALGFSSTPTFVVAPNRPDSIVHGRVIRGAAAIGDLQAAIDHAAKTGGAVQPLTPDGRA